ncbi:MAG TPA: arylsulfotransferase family protein [Solirubrobacteraceae bacterium]|nr:arylsulfotransferase family protein [Solirubrobacteraceae bacterium]
MSRRLHLSLLIAGLLVLVCSAGTLAFGGNRIVAEEAAYVGPAAPQCVPSTIDRSAVLPGTHLAVSPLPDSLDASPRTQISLLGAPAHEISDVQVGGSYTGKHYGRLEAYSQGDGASFVPDQPFVPGETVTVRGRLAVGRGSEPFAFHFTISRPNPLQYHQPSREPAGGSGEVQHFVSAPSLQPPAISITTHTPQESPGDVFTAPYSGPGGDGPMIFNSAGQLIWFHPLPFGIQATNFEVQQYEGKPALTWWQGYIPPQGFGQGEVMIYNDAYQQVARIAAGNGYKADLHEFHIDADDTAVLTVMNPIHCDLTAVGGPQDGSVTDSLYQEIDLRTHLVRREWTSLDHVALSESYSSPIHSSTEWPYDFFHMNSIDVQSDGEVLLSARNTWALYELNGQTGQIVARAGGRHSTIKMGDGTLTAYQHDAVALTNGMISVFDNGGVPMVHQQSRGIVVSLDAQTGSETLVGQYVHPTALKAGSQGDVQEQANGNFFLGWGAEPWFSEFTSSGQLVFDGRMPNVDESYRTFRFPWNATPAAPPSIAARTSKSGQVTVYASWNGATEVASWRVLAGASPHALKAVASAAGGGFETAIPTPAAAYVQVQALSPAGAVLGTSPAIKS